MDVVIQASRPSRAGQRILPRYPLENTAEDQIFNSSWRGRRGDQYMA